MIGSRLCPARSGYLFSRSWIPCRPPGTRIPSGRATLITFVKVDGRDSESTDPWPKRPPRNVRKRLARTGAPNNAVDEQSDGSEPRTRGFVYRPDVINNGSNADRTQSGSTRLSSAANDTRLKYAFRRAKSDQDNTLDPKVARVRFAMESKNLTEFIAAYRALGEDFVLSRLLIQDLTRFLNQTAASLDPRSENARLLSAFVRHLVEEMQAGRLATDHRLTQAVLAVFTNAGDPDGAESFWEWLEAQPDHALSTHTYAAAMRLYESRAEPLSRMLELYEKAIARFPGHYSSYHLSPQAVLPDREAALDFKIPLTLLGQLGVAYFRSGSTRDAYLAFDTMFRLQPLLRSNFFASTFLPLRPMSELHTLFGVRSRRDGSDSGFHAKRMLNSVHDQIKVLPTKAYFAIMRYLLVAIYGERANSKNGMFNDITTWVTYLREMMYLRPLANQSRSDRAECARALFLLVKKLIGALELRKERPKIALFNAMLSSFAQFDDTGEALNYITTMIAQNEAGIDRSAQLSLITLYGKQHKPEQIKAAWSELTASMESKKEPLAVRDMRVLIIASNRANCADFAREQVEKYQGMLGEDSRDQFAAMFEYNPGLEPVAREEKLYDPATLAEFMGYVNALSRDVDVMHREIEKKTKDPTYKGLQFPTTIFPPEGALRLSETEMRTLYDEFTTIPEPQSSDTVSDPASDARSTKGPEQFDLMEDLDSEEGQTEPNSTSDSQAVEEQTESVSNSDSEAASSSSTKTTLSSPPSDAVSSSSSNTTATAESTPDTSFGTLRYQNWRDFTYLLQLADRHDNLPTKLTGQIGDPVFEQKRLEEINLDDFSRFENFTLSAAAERMANPPVEAPPRTGAELDEARAEIRRLRQPVNWPQT